MRGHCTFFLTIVMLLGILAIYGMFHMCLIGKLGIGTWIIYTLPFLVVFISTTALVFIRVEGLFAPDSNYLDNDRLCIDCFSQWSICMMYTMGLSVVVSIVSFLVGWILTTIKLAQDNSNLLIWNYLYLFYIILLLAGFLNKGYKKYKEFKEVYPSLL